VLMPRQNEISHPDPERAIALGFAMTIAEQARAVPNNGFNTDNVYVARDPFSTGELRVFNELTGTVIGDLAVGGSKWDTLCFSGVGTNDARLFVARQPLDTADVEIAELNSSGAMVGT